MTISPNDTEPAGKPKRRRKAKLLVDSNGQAEMPIEQPFEEAYLCEGNELEARYTTEHSGSIAEKREICLYMLGAAVPLNEISRLLHLNKRTVTAINAKYHRQVSDFSEKHARRLLSMGGEMFARAMLKAEDARFGELAMAGGILHDKALAMKLAVSGGMDDTKTVQEEREDEDVKKARAFILAKRLEDNGKVVGPAAPGSLGTAEIEKEPPA